MKCQETKFIIAALIELALQYQISHKSYFYVLNIILNSNPSCDHLGSHSGKKGHDIQQKLPNWRSVFDRQGTGCIVFIH